MSVSYTGNTRNNPWHLTVVLGTFIVPANKPWLASQRRKKTAVHCDLCVCGRAMKLMVGLPLSPQIEMNRTVKFAMGPQETQQFSSQ